ncbi:MAG: hypothetical protein WBR29_07340 [Gammaproteobacteria bacterium]
MSAAFSVGRHRQTGAPAWWVNWQMAGIDMAGSHDDIRPATAEEAALMDKVVWDSDTAADRDRLKELLGRT